MRAPLTKLSRLQGRIRQYRYLRLRLSWTFIVNITVWCTHIRHLSLSKFAFPPLKCRYFVHVKESQHFKNGFRDCCLYPLSPVCWAKKFKHLFSIPLVSYFVLYEQIAGIKRKEHLLGKIKHWTGGCSSVGSCWVADQFSATSLISSVCKNQNAVIFYFSKTKYC